MRIVSIVGARPQFIKVAPIAWQAEGKYDHLIIHTGQHYDPELSTNFFSELGIPEPVAKLYSGSGNHGAQTARILEGVEESLLSLKPDWVLVYGDTNSTIAAALAAAKLGIRIGHIEAGLRSFNRIMPEEINRVLVDHVSDLLFAPTIDSFQNLKNEGLEDRSLQVGDVMVETLNRIKQKVLGINFVQSKKLIATIHRAENTDNRERLNFIIERLAKSPVPVILYAHPRLINRAEHFGLSLQRGSIVVQKPQPYMNIIRGVLESVGVITDSGGLQKETYLLERPCLTIRTETEWVETLQDYWNQLDPSLELVGDTWWENERPPIRKQFYGSGTASLDILNAITFYKG